MSDFGAQRKISHLEQERDRLRDALLDIKQYVEEERGSARWTVILASAKNGLRQP